MDTHVDHVFGNRVAVALGYVNNSTGSLLTLEEVISDRKNGRSAPARILLVEDNPGDVRLMREALKMQGTATELAVAEDGELALRYLRQQDPFSDAHRPDLIFLDLNLPRRDGREVLAEIKGDTSLRRIPVIVLTTSEAERDVYRMYDLHANCYIRKPPDLDRYLEVIQACEKFWLEVVRLPGDL